MTYTMCNPSLTHPALLPWRRARHGRDRHLQGFDVVFERRVGNGVAAGVRLDAVDGQSLSRVEADLLQDQRRPAGVFNAGLQQDAAVYHSALQA